MSIIETLQNPIINHFNNSRFAEAEKQLDVLRSQLSRYPSVLAKAISKIAKDSKVSPPKKLALFEEAYQLDNSEYIANSYAESLAKCKKYEEAFYVFEQLLSNYSKNICALNNYGKALVENGHYEKACEIFERSVEINPNDSIILTKYGIALFENGNSEKACEMFKLSLKKEPNNSITLKAIAKIDGCQRSPLLDNLVNDNNCKTAYRIFKDSYSNIEDLQNAIIANFEGYVFQEAWRLLDILRVQFRSDKKNLAIALTNIANSKNVTVRKNLQLLKEAYNFYPSNKYIGNSYAVSLANLRDFEQAYNIFKKFLPFDSNNRIFLNGYFKTLNGYGDVLEKRGNYEKSHKLFYEALKIQPDNRATLRRYIKTLNSYDSVLKKNNNYKNILEIFERYLDIKPDDLIVLNIYGKILADSGNYEKSYKTFQRSLKINPTDSYALNGYGNALAKNGLYDKACEIFECLLKNNPNNIYALNSYGKTLADNGNYEKAYEMFETILEIEPNNSVTFLLYANALQEQGKYVKAIEFFEHIKLTDLHVYLTDFIHLKLGHLYCLIGRLDKGKKYFDKIIETSPYGEAAKLTTAIDLLISNPMSTEGIAGLREITEQSPFYIQARRMLAHYLDPQSYYETFKTGEEEDTHTDTASLNRALYHKIQNEIAILKELVYDLISDFATEEFIFTRILENISNIFEGIKQRRNQEESKIKAIQHHNYTQLLTAISQTAHDIVDFVGNKLAAIKEDIWETLSETEKNSPLYNSLNQLLQRIENTQTALNDLKAVNEGIRIKNTTFTITELFSIWMNTPKIRHAQINLKLINAEDIINSDKEKIKSFLNELVENSLKHNPDKNNLVITMKTEMSNNPNIPSLKINKKYLHIIFTDNGVGVAKDKKEWIFLPLASTSAKGEGSGLGLFMIKRILKELHGYISESGNNGVKFDIYIPYEA